METPKWRLLMTLGASPQPLYALWEVPRSPPYCRNWGPSAYPPPIKHGHVTWQLKIPQNMVKGGCGDIPAFFVLCDGFDFDVVGQCFIFTFDVSMWCKYFLEQFCPELSLWLFGLNAGHNWWLGLYVYVWAGSYFIIYLTKIYLMIELLWLKPMSAVKQWLEFCFVLVGLTSYQLVISFDEQSHRMVIMPILHFILETSAK